MLVDNRDISTTWLWEQEDAMGGCGTVFEVNPWELVENAIENAGLSNDATRNVIDALRELKKDVEKEMEG